MPTTAPTATFEFDGEPIGVVREIDVQNNYETIRTNLPEYDPDWVGIDSNGHEHRWIDHQLTNAEIVIDEVYWCEGCRDEHTRSHLECTICRETIEPGTHIPPDRQLLVSREMTVTVDLPPQRIQPRTGSLMYPATLVLPDERIVGRAVVFEVTSDGSGHRLKVTFVPDEDASNR